MFRDGTRTGVNVLGVPEEGVLLLTDLDGAAAELLKQASVSRSKGGGRAPVSIPKTVTVAVAVPRKTPEGIKRDIPEESRPCHRR